jgi:hemerythrin
MEQSLYIVWDRANELGIAIIDEQHKAIVSTINSLYYFMQESLAAAAVEPTLHVLVEYTRLHFTTEEHLMERAAYPQFEAHRQLHLALTEQTIGFSRRHIEPESAREILSFLKAWWLGHINREDRQYAPFVHRLIAQHG